MAKHKPQDEAMGGTSCWLEDQISRRLVAETGEGCASQSLGLSAGSLITSEAKQPVTSLLPDEKKPTEFCAYRAKKLTPFPKAHLNVHNEEEEEENTATGSRRHEERASCTPSKPRSGLLCGACSCFSKSKDKRRPNDDLGWKKRDEQCNHSNMAGAFDERKKDNRCHVKVGEKNSSDLVSKEVADTNSDSPRGDPFPPGNASKKRKFNFRFFKHFQQMTRTKPHQVSWDSSRGTAKDGHCSDKTPAASTTVFSPSHSILSSRSKMKISDSSQQSEVKRVSFRETAEVMQSLDKSVPLSDVSGGGSP